MDTQRTTVNVLALLLLGVLGWAAIDAFGLLHGAGVVAAVWLLMPYGKG